MDNKKVADLAGPGIGNYQELEQILPSDYSSVLTRRETQKAIFAVKHFIEDSLCKELQPDDGYGAADGGPGERRKRHAGPRWIANSHSISHQQRPESSSPGCTDRASGNEVEEDGAERIWDGAGEGLCTDMRAVRKDYFLDHDHSAYVDQWDWERVITADERNETFLREIVGKIWKVLVDAERFAQELFPELRSPKYPNLPERLTFLPAEDLLKMYPKLPRKQRETAILQECPALFIVGIGYPLEDGYPHEMRAADYDDWVTETKSPEGKIQHGLNGDILVWNHVTKRRHELSSMGIRVNAETLKKQLELSKQTEFLKFPYHQAIVKNEIPLSIGGGIGQSRTMMLLLRKAHLGEVTVSVWPKILKEICAKKNIHVLE